MTVHAVILYNRTGVRGVDERTVTNIDTYMTNGTAAEEHKVAGLEIRDRGNLGESFALLTGSSRNGNTQSVAVNIRSKAGAIKTGRGGTAVYIGGAKIVCSERKKLVHGRVGNLSNGFSKGSCKSYL